MRLCYLCKKPLPIPRRHSAFCSLRCEQLAAALESLPERPASPQTKPGEFTDPADPPGVPSGPKDGPPARGGRRD
ncbi:MAG: hypothetical protein OEW12_08795 [Deltaproteobacteria bacterium]|nr:hypothetical protein [Deltaproteobacteria bacterium]